jgi:hypothetical protein
MGGGVVARTGERERDDGRNRVLEADILADFGPKHHHRWSMKLNKIYL